MDRLKTFFIYFIIFVAFFFFSNVLIFVGLNTNYKNISNRGEIPSEVQISQAEATLVNGRIRGTITNNGEEDLNGKYMRVNLYSKRDVLLGTKYLDINNLEQGATDNFELYFKANNVEYYDIIFTDTAEFVHKDLNVFIGRALNKGEIILGTMILLIFLG